MNRKLNVVLAAAAAMALSAAPASAQLGGIFGRSSNGIPSNEMPSPGMCRVWIDGLSTRQQPRETDCRTAERQLPYYEQRYGRSARVIYSNRNNGRYDTRNGAVILGKGNGNVYGSNGTNCRTVDQVIMGRVIRRQVCDNNGGVYDRNGRVYDPNGRVYDRNGNVVYDRNSQYGRNGQYDRNGRGRNDNRDSDDKGHGKHKGNRRGD